MENQKKEFPAHIFQPKELFSIILLILLFYLLGMLFAALMVFLGFKKLALLGEGFFILPAIGIVLYHKKPFAKTFRFNKTSLQILFFSILLSFPVLILSDELDRLITSIFPLPAWFDAKALMQIDTFWQGVLIIGNAVVIAAIAEEMLFRGLIQQTLESVRDTASAIFLSAVFFALLHLNPWWMIQITILGLVLGYMAWKSNSIWPVIIVHALNNLLAVISLNSSEDIHWYTSGGHVRWYWIALAAVVIIPSFFGFQKACEKNESSGGPLYE